MAEELKNGPEYGRPLNGAGVRRISRSATIDLKSKLKIGTWNLRSLYEAGKTHNTIQEMKRLDIPILGVSEMRWPNSGKCNIEEHTVYYSGEDSNYHINGVAFIVSKHVEKCVKSVCYVSDRVIMLQLNSRPVDINLIQVYAPTSVSDEEEIEKFYDTIKSVTDKIKKKDITIIMGDLNAKVGQGREDKVVGDFGLGIRNERGDRFVEFCRDNNLCIMNTFYKLPKRRLYTWKHPSDSPEKPVRNQIDYITINERYRNSVQAVKTFPGADVPSDHVLLVARFKLRLKKVERKQPSKKLNVDYIRDNHEVIMNTLENKCEEKILDCNIEDHWNKFKNIVSETTSNIPIAQQKKQNWMNDDILHLMEERRSFKNQDQQKYQLINKEIRKKIRAAKEAWFVNQCKEVEELQKRHDTFNLHKRVKELTGVNTNRTHNLVDKDGNLIVNDIDKLRRWKEYIEELFDDERIENVIQQCNTGPMITMGELEKAIKTAKNRKATGPDEIPSEILKCLDIKGKQSLLSLFNKIYESGVIPTDWIKSTFVMIPKKGNSRKCSDYRTISLMSHVLKIFLRIIHSRVYAKIEEQISETQFGFRNNLGTREALFCIQVLVQRCRDVDHPVFMCFIDFEKAFDRVKHDKLVAILREVGIDDKDLQIIRNLYWNQQASVKIGKNTSETIAIRRGVRQGCIMSPLLFNLYSEFIFREALEEIDGGVKVNGVNVNNLKYADDTVLLASSPEELQLLLDRVTSTCDEYGLKLNTQKTKLMTVSKHPINPIPITAYGVDLEQVDNITYLGSNINNDWDMSKEIKQRIEKARSVFYRMKKVLCSRNINIELKLRLTRCYIFSTLLYGAESWTLTETLLKKLQAFEMWVYRRLLRISWVDKVRNEEVLSRLSKQPEINKNIKIRKLEYFAHVIRHPERYNVLHLIMQGKIEGKRGPGRRRTSWLRNLRDWFQKSSAALFRAAANKIIIANMIANVR